MQSPGAILPLVPAQQVSVGMTSLLCIISCAAQCLDLFQQRDKSDLACQLAYAAHHVTQPAGIRCPAGPTGQSRHVVLSACEAV